MQSRLRAGPQGARKNPKNLVDLHYKEVAATEETLLRNRTCVLSAVNGVSTEIAVPSRLAGIQTGYRP